MEGFNQIAHNLKSQPNGPVIELGLPFLQVTVLVEEFLKDLAIPLGIEPTCRGVESL